YNDGGPVSGRVTGLYNPTHMAIINESGNRTINILFGIPNAGRIQVVDPYALNITDSDWCTTHAAPRSDGGVSDASRDSSSDASMSIDASIDASNNDASTDSRDASSDSRSDASVDSSSDARDAGSDSRSDASVDAPRG
ncbi:MAG: hypothetical protein JNK65_09285, partial [Deltaproteobacteria bacterium]|nr:hypothetical protein [Deltaproteobacteria bacterium]